MKKIIKKIKSNYENGTKSNLTALCISTVTFFSYTFALIYPDLPQSKFLLDNATIIGSTLSTIILSLFTIFSK